MHKQYFKQTFLADHYATPLFSNYKKHTNNISIISQKLLNFPPQWGALCNISMSDRPEKKVQVRIKEEGSLLDLVKNLGELATFLERSEVAAKKNDNRFR